MSPKITIVDDDAHPLVFVRRIITEACPEAEIVCFNSPRNALEYICKIGSDLLFTDHGMGEMCGTELILRLREQAVPLPVIMISSDSNTRNEAIAAGACEFLNKGELNKLPVLLVSLLSRIEAMANPQLRHTPHQIRSAAIG